MSDKSGHPFDIATQKREDALNIGGSFKRWVPNIFDKASYTMWRYTSTEGAEILIIKESTDPRRQQDILSGLAQMIEKVGDAADLMTGLASKIGQYFIEEKLEEGKLEDHTEPKEKKLEDHTTLKEKKLEDYIITVRNWILSSQPPFLSAFFPLPDDENEKLKPDALTFSLVIQLHQAVDPEPSAIIFERNPGFI
ncbi:hypothetical protein BDV95DRAFT_603574 [Massariosphaeria phaeospora]|uniref:Uncharacterized protein n=1 Tax=Massariosphaeria phaeospora TaxID=100035 RepID=A0A7C8ME83_9PLEO|nr:hypothetical protein BDV95DRAFT_603574 [Massariosphaeria phaeospora]